MPDMHDDTLPNLSRSDLPYNVRLENIAYDLGIGKPVNSENIDDIKKEIIDELQKKYHYIRFFKKSPAEFHEDEMEMFENTLYCHDSPISVRIIGPIGLGYIQFRNTEIFLFPELHEYGSEDEITEIRGNNKSIINIEAKEIFNSLIENSGLCIDYFSETFSYRPSIGGAHPQRYKALHNTSDQYERFAYYPTENTNKDVFYHYTDFRHVHFHSNFRIWDYIRHCYKSSSRPHFPLEHKFFQEFFYNPKSFIDLVKSYYLYDNFSKSVRNIFPQPIINRLFNLKVLKRYKGNYVHPIRKEIDECPYRVQILNFLNRHINNLFKKFN